MPMLDACAASAAGRSAVKGGATTISTSCTSFARLRNSLMNATASRTVLCIFQFAAIKGVRLITVNCKLLTRPVRQRSDPRQLPAAQEFERRAAAGRDVRDPIGDAGLGHRRDRVAAAD